MRKRSTLLLKFILALCAGVLILVVFVGVGLLNHRNFQQRAITESESVVGEYFSNRNETLKAIYRPDYSLGGIELGAITDKNSYYVLLGVTNSPLVSCTLLNLWVKPSIVIIEVRVQELKT